MNSLWWRIPIGALLLGILFACNRTVLDLSEQNSCPYCYGNDFCEALQQASLQYNSVSKIAFNLFSVKNVFFARIGNKEVVLKKLADFGEHAKLSRDVFINIGRENVVKLLSDSRRNFHTCNQESAKGLLGKLPPKTMFNLWTLISVNAEPLVLEVFSKQNNWPVPQLLGYCGRLVVEENCGVPLNEIQMLDWHHRAHVTLQLLQAADQFTSGHEDFRLYLTDISPDNIAVNLQDFSVAFVDLEHGILQSIRLSVYTYSIETPGYLGATYHYTQHMPEEDYAFSSDLICGSSISDHNIYAVCRLLLSSSAPWPMMPGGLLHSPVPSVASKELFSHIELCVHSENATSRFVLAKTIQQILRDVLNKDRYYTD